VYYRIKPHAPPLV